MAVKVAKHELLVFSDCRQRMKKGSVKQLVHNFNDTEVGTVTSTLLDSSVGKKFSFRNILNFIADCESKVGSSLNVFGALYAQRKSVYREIPTDILFDDLFVVVSTIVQKKRLITEKNAVIYDVPFKDYYMKNRIHRLARGLLIFLFNHFKLIRQLPWLVCIRFIVFKYLKLLLPFVIISLLFDLVFFSSILFQWKYLVFFILAFFVLIAFNGTRIILIHLIKINYHFFIATSQFLFMKNRSNKWDKLKV
jgi:hypothetical protein